MSPRSVSDLERGISRTARKDTAVLLAGALGLAGPARELFVTVARGQAPTAQMLAAARGTFAAGTPPGLPRDGGGLAGGQGELAWLLGAVTGSPYRGLAAFGEQDAGLFFGREAATAQVLDRMSRHAGGRGAADGVGGVGGGQVVAAAGGGAAADPGGWAGGRAGGGVRGRVWCSPRAGRRWMSWRCGWRCWRGPTRPRCGGGWTPRRRGSPSPRGRPPWRGHLAGRRSGWPRGRARPAAAAAPVAAGGGPVRGAVHPVPRRGAAAGVHHRAARGRHRRPRPGSGPGGAGGAGGARRLRGPVRGLPAAGRRGPGPVPGHRDDRAAAADGDHRTGQEGRLRRR